MNSKHLTAESELPPLQDGKLRIYNLRVCPYSQRVLLVAEAKEIPYDVVNIQYKEKPKWFLERNPEGKVPTIETPKGPLYESLIIMQYLDDAYRTPRLSSTDSYQRAIDKIWMENSSKIGNVYYKIVPIINDYDEALMKGLFKELEATVTPFETELKRRGTTYFGGSKPGLLDYALWPWLERIAWLKIPFSHLYDFNGAKSQNPTLEKWRQTMKEDKGVKVTRIPSQIHNEFVTKIFAGKPDYTIVEHLLDAHKH